MEEILSLIDKYQVWVIFAIIFFSLLLLIFIIIQGVIIGRWKKKYYSLMGDKDYNSLEEMLSGHNVQVGKILENVEEILEKQKYVGDKLEHCVQRVGITRYNAFNDMGSDLSYSVALLDGKNNGVVMSGIFGRDFCNTYAKPIENGESTYMLSAEEILALDRAKRSNG